MIITTAVRWCRHCQRLVVHEIESHAKKNQVIDDYTICNDCLHRYPVPHPTRAAQQNGGSGDQRYAGRRKAL